MTMTVILNFLKMLIPKKKIGAWLLGIIAAGVALFMGVNNAEMKAAFCASAPVELPAAQSPPPVEVGK